MSLEDISYKELLLKIQTNKELGVLYFKNLFNKYYKKFNDIELIIDKPLSSIMGFYPLPDNFNTEILQKHDAVLQKNDIYFYFGEPGDRMLFANRRLPIIGKDPVPFMFPIKKNNNTKIILSNTFYFEVKILNKQFRKGWNNECLSLGYGSTRTSYKAQVGWTEKSWGFHSDDGCYINNNISMKFSQKWELNDVIGVGLTYLSKTKYKIFLTRNGLIVNDEQYITCEDEEMIPMMGFDLSYPVFVNWGFNEFTFDLEKYVSSSNILSTANTFLSKKEPLCNYSVIPKIFFSSKQPNIFHSKVIDINGQKKIFAYFNKANKDLIDDSNSNQIIIQGQNKYLNQYEASDSDFDIPPLVSLQSSLMNINPSATITSLFSSEGLFNQNSNLLGLSNQTNPVNQTVQVGPVGHIASLGLNGSTEPSTSGNVTYLSSNLIYNQNYMATNNNFIPTFSSIIKTIYFDGSGNIIN
jgi:hypothetical protein